MFKNAKKAEREQLTELLSFIVTGTKSEVGRANVPFKLAQRINALEPGSLQIHGAPDTAGNTHVSATERVLKVGAESQNVASNEGAVAETAKPTYELETGFEPPVTRRGGFKTDIYPFDKMSVGQSFFVPATEKRPNPAKALQSTISSASRRYATTYPATVGKDKHAHPKAGQPTGKDGRKFVVRARTAADGEKSDGARVYRTV
jgi:hypothetical protein